MIVKEISELQTFHCFLLNLFTDYNYVEIQMHGATLHTLSAFGLSSSTFELQDTKNEIWGTISELYEVFLLPFFFFLTRYIL